ncbi:MAG: hypothetical protein AAGI66_00510 [Cyanobacteria bacterium P01_H01_bin.74]
MQPLNHKVGKLPSALKFRSRYQQTNKAMSPLSSDFKNSQSKSAYEPSSRKTKKQTDKKNTRYDSMVMPNALFFGSTHVSMRNGQRAAGAGSYQRVHGAAFSHNDSKPMSARENVSTRDPEEMDKE